MTSLSRRLARRMTHRSRSASAVLAASAVALAGGYLATEIVLELVGSGPLLVAPDALVAGLNEGGPWALPVATGLAVAALVLIVVAIVPGRRRRRTLADDRMVVVVDDAVVAGALRQTASTGARIAPSRVRAAVTRRRVEIDVVPTSGVPVDRAAAAAASVELLTTVRATPSLRPVVRVAETGVVGA